MINWEKEYKILRRFLIGVIILITIALIMFIIGFRGTSELIQQKQDEIWQREVEIEDLKEQIHILKNIEKKGQQIEKQ